MYLYNIPNDTLLFHGNVIILLYDVTKHLMNMHVWKEKGICIIQEFMMVLYWIWSSPLLHLSVSQC